MCFFFFFLVGSWFFLFIFFLTRKSQLNGMNFKSILLKQLLCQMNSALFTSFNMAFLDIIPNSSQSSILNFTLSYVHRLLAQSNVAFLHLNRYSVEANSLEHSCSCCRETKTSTREVELKCPSGRSIQHKYVYVESCSCQDTHCNIPQSSEPLSLEENNKSTSTPTASEAISLTKKWKRRNLTAFKGTMHCSHLPWLLLNFAFPS